MVSTIGMQIMYTYIAYHWIKRTYDGVKTSYATFGDFQWSSITQLPLKIRNYVIWKRWVRPSYRSSFMYQRNEIFTSLL